ncbi:MAG TPA: M48 family metalloprotease, partial [Gammaproteobacteria bacterium]|nr:M48 family metalloprotease [Gammaproteobacteria bacterium]
AHVKHRDPIVALGRGLTISVALATLAGLTDSSLLEGVLNQAGVITALKFNRTQEEAADDAALEALGRIYGHVHGAGELFEILRAGSGVEPPAFFSTHPVTDERVAKIEALTRGTPVRALIELPTFEGTAD